MLSDNAIVVSPSVHSAIHSFNMYAMSIAPINCLLHHSYDQYTAFRPYQYTEVYSIMKRISRAAAGSAESPKAAATNGNTQTAEQEEAPIDTPDVLLQLSGHKRSKVVKTVRKIEGGRAGDQLLARVRARAKATARAAAAAAAKASGETLVLDADLAVFSDEEEDEAEDPVAADLSSDTAVVAAIERDVHLLARACYQEWSLYAALLPLCAGSVRAGMEGERRSRERAVWARQTFGHAVRLSRRARSAAATAAPIGAYCYKVIL
jgi:hypothetical protein